MRIEDKTPPPLSYLEKKWGEQKPGERGCVTKHSPTHWTLMWEDRTGTNIMHYNPQDKFTIACE